MTKILDGKTYARRMQRRKAAIEQMDTDKAAAVRTTWNREAYYRRMTAERELAKAYRGSLTESQLQIAVVDHLRLRGVPGLLFFKIPNEGKRTRANGARMKAEGMLAGVADLFIKAPRQARPMFLELKRKGQKPTKEQKAFGDAADLAFCWWEWADNLDDALQHLSDYGAFR